MLFLNPPASPAPGSNAWVSICHDVVSLVECEQERGWGISQGPAKKMKTTLDISSGGNLIQRSGYASVRGSRRQRGNQRISKKEEA